MKIINQQVFHQIEVKKSTFLSYIFPFKEFSPMLQKLKDNHPKAAHFVYAYRVFENMQIIERFSDDGEPKGSSGMPILNVLRGNDLIDSAVIVVRYFGGTLLGIGGLVRAYTQSVVECLKKAQSQEVLQDFVFKEHIQIRCPYALLSRIKHLAKSLEIQIQEEDFGSYEVQMSLFATKDKLEIFKAQYQELQFKI